MAELFRSKQDLFTVEANQIRRETYEAVALWCGGLAVVEHDALNHSAHFPAVNVPCGKEHEMKRAQEMSWVVKYPAGYFNVLPDALFRATYEEFADA